MWWHHPEKNIFTTIPNHSGNIPEGTVRAIVKQAQVAIDDFLQA
ncbi:MAG: type II toxin-antitoxin system HicA family toxin [bacterium]